LSKRIFEFTVKNEKVLGFDTGLSAQAFAQAKMAQFITNPGAIVYPDGRIEAWQPGGVTEHSREEEAGIEGNVPPENKPKVPETIVIWGPSFPGETLTTIINDDNRKEEALNSLAYWIKARALLEKKLKGEDEIPYPGPSGALIVCGDGKKFPGGTVFFPPFRLLKRTLEAEGKGAILDAQRWVHPDLKGEDAISFSAGAMLYRIFCNAPPFPKDDEDELRQDIREAVFLPPELATAGLEPEMAEIINRSLGRSIQAKDRRRSLSPITPAASAQKPSGTSKPGPDVLSGLIGPASSRSVSSWIKPLTEEEISKIRTEQEQYTKKKSLEVKTRRFIIRNTAIIAAVLIAVVIVALIVRGAIKHEGELPTTKGMTPVEVVSAYYNAFGNLDHPLMQACVTGKAGKGDIDMVVNLYVISRVRQAYEATGNSFLSAQDWINEGSPDTEKNVFGVSNLLIKTYSENHGTANLEVEYILWMPGAYLKDDSDNSQSAEATDANGEDDSQLPPAGLVTKDKLILTQKNSLWHITEIDRTTSPMK